MSKPLLTGDLTLPVNPVHRRRFKKLLQVLSAVALELNETLHVNSGYRSYAEQVKLYALYLAGKGNLAAKPGTSNHNKGLAADVSAADGTPIGGTVARRKVLKQHGLCLPVSGELWHVERGDSWVAAKRP